MARGFAQHLRSNVVGYIALFVALSGTAYAAATIGSGHVIDNSLRSVDIANGVGVGGVDVINNDLRGADIDESTLLIGRTVARARSTGPVTTSGVGSPLNVPVSGGTFIQAGSGVISQVLARIQYDRISCPPSNVLSVNFFITGVATANVQIPLTTATTDAVFSAPVDFSPMAFEPGAATSRTLTVQVSDSCTGADVTVDSIAANVVEIR